MDLWKTGTRLVEAWQTLVEGEGHCGHMDHIPDLLHLFVQALAQFSKSLDSWFHIPWPLPIAALFLPLMAALNVTVWTLRGRVFPIRCDYPTTKKGNCSRPAIGEWHRCWQHRKGKWRKTDKHLVDPKQPRWENQLYKGVGLETGKVQGRGFLGMRSRRDTLLYHQGFTRRPGDVFKVVPSVFRDYRRRIAQRWDDVRFLGFSGLLGVTERGKRQIATSHVLPEVIRATRFTLSLIAIGLVLVIASIPVPSWLGVTFEYCATYSFIVAFAIIQTGILKADGLSSWSRKSVVTALKWMLALTVFAALGGLVGLYGDEFADKAKAITATLFSGASAVFFFLYLILLSNSKPRGRNRRRRW